MSQVHLPRMTLRIYHVTPWLVCSKANSTPTSVPRKRSRRHQCLMTGARGRPQLSPIAALREYQCASRLVDADSGIGWKSRIQKSSAIRDGYIRLSRCTEDGEAERPNLSSVPGSLGLLLTVLASSFSGIGVLVCLEHGRSQREFGVNSLPLQRRGGRNT